MKPVDPRLLRHARHSRGAIAVLALLGTGQAACTLAVAVALSLIVAGHSGGGWPWSTAGHSGGGWPWPTAGHSGGGWPWPAGAGDRSWPVVLLGGAFVVRAALVWAEQVVAHRTAARVSDELRRALVRATARRGPAWVARFGAGRLTALLTGGLDALRPWFAGYLPALVLGVALPPLVVLAIAVVDPASALIALATLPLIPLLGALIGWATQTRARQRWAADARLAGHFLDVVRGLATLRVFGRAERQTAVIADLTDRHRAATLRVLRVAFLSSTALDLVGTLSVGLIAVEAGLRVAAGHLALGPALLIILLAPEAYRPLREMAARYHAATDATAVIADVDEVLHDLPPALPTGTGTTAGLATAGLATAGLATVGLAAAALRVRYPGTTRDALFLPGLVLGAGELVALTGPSGAGKTTALRALAGLQPVDAGTIALDNTPVYLPQTPSLPHARTVADVFLPGTPPAEIEAALRSVGLASPNPHSGGTASPDQMRPDQMRPDQMRPDQMRPVLAAASQPGGNLSAGTPLGEHGAGVSAGQRHRLALAAALQQTPATLLLDEPTAHLDPATEELVLTRLREAAAAGSAILVAAHRPALLAAADRIITISAPPAPPPSSPDAQPTPLAGPATVQADQAATQPTPPTSPAGPAGPAATLAGPPTPPAGPTSTHSAPPPGPTAPSAEPTTTPAGPTTTPAGPTTPPSGPTATPSGPTATPAGPTTPPAEPTTPPAEPTATPAEPTATPGVSAAWPVTAGLGRRRSSAAAATPGTDRHGDVSGGASTPAGGAGTPPRTVRRWERWRRPGIAVGLGAGSSLAGLVLTGAAAWLLVRAASLPPVLTLSAAVVLVRGSAVARPLLRYVERLVAHDVAFARLGARRAYVYATLVPRVPGPRLRRRGDLLTKVVDDVDARVDGLLRGRLPAWAAGLTLAVGSVVAVGMAPNVAVPLLAGLVIAGVAAPVVAARRAASQETATSVARAALRDAMVETVDGVQEVRGRELTRVPERRSRELATREAQAARSAGGAVALAHLGWGVAVVGTALAVGRTGLHPEWSAVLLLGVVALGEASLGLPDAAIARMRSAAAGRRLAELAAEPAPVRFPAGETAVDRGAIAFGAVSVRGLVAGWGDRPVLDGLDLDLPRGAKVAVRGRSGAGKSTLGAVLARLLDPRAGTLAVGGRDFRTLPEPAVRGRIVLVGDDTGHVFASTVRENLRLARPAADDDELRNALGRVRLDGWLAGLPAGLDTWLGTGGSTMSGGQARRLATARALLAEPDLLILDEPTEGLDEHTARALMDDLLDAADGRTVLMLTHRTEGLDRVDRVLTLRDGRLSVESAAGSR